MKDGREVYDDDFDNILNFGGYVTTMCDVMIPHCCERASLSPRLYDSAHLCTFCERGNTRRCVVVDWSTPYLCEFQWILDIFGVYGVVWLWLVGGALCHTVSCPTAS